MRIMDAMQVWMRSVVLIKRETVPVATCKGTFSSSSRFAAPMNCCIASDSSDVIEGIGQTVHHVQQEKQFGDGIPPCEADAFRFMPVDFINSPNKQQ